MSLKDIASKLFSVARKPYEAVYGGKPAEQDIEKVRQLPKQQFRQRIYNPQTKQVFPSTPIRKYFKLSPEEQSRKLVKVATEMPIAFGGALRATSARKKLFDFVKRAKPLERAQAQLYSKTRSVRIAKAKTVKVKGLAGLQEARGKLAGEMEKLPHFKPPKFSKKVVDDLADSIRGSNQLDEFGKISAGKGFEDVLAGRIPVKSQIAQLEKVFGPEFAGNLAKLQTNWQKVGQLAGEVLGVPRSLMAGGLDMSYGLRQGVFGGWKHPKQWASSFKKQFGWFAKRKTLLRVWQKLSRERLIL